MSRQKTKKKAQYYALENTFDKENTWPGQWREKLEHQGKIILEVGCGKAELSLEMARRYPDIHFIGIDVKTDRMGVAGREAQEEGLSNVSFLRIHLLEIDQFFAENEVDEIWITFPDPFPKKRQIKHRMMNVPFLEKYRHILVPNGIIHYKTDNLDLFKYSLEVFIKQDFFTIEELSFDLHENEELPDDLKIKTTYEKKFMDLGFSINYTRLRMKA